MWRSVWNGAVLAESGDTVRLEGNHYFPAESLKTEFFTDSSHTSVCPWKGQARYYDVEVAGRRNPGAAWYYPDPSVAAERIRGRVAFWRGVKIERVPGPEGADGAAEGWLGRLRRRLAGSR
jgi:uncharacterized protein (DUF427 family)